MTLSKPVGVVVPMYNASRTIAATLESLLKQSYKDLEIVVVDDGSDDDCGAIVEAFAHRDSRVRLLRQANAGVAAARNAGAAACSGDLLSFIDADDLWAPSKIERQLDMLAKSPDVDVVYCWFALICEESRTYPVWPRQEASGDVLQDLCRKNFVGNGSSLLVTRQAFERAGGFDATLRARGGQGCEDWLICLRLAEHYRFAMVPEFLVGYREHDQNMSSDYPQMLRSTDLVIAEYAAKYPQYAADLQAHRDEVLIWLVARAARAGRLAVARRLAAEVQPSRADDVRDAVRYGYRSYLTNVAVPKPVRRLLRLLPILRKGDRRPYLEQFGEKDYMATPIKVAP